MGSSAVDERKTRRLCRVIDFKKPLDIPKNVGYVVNNPGVKYVDILSASRYANGVRLVADFHFIKRF